MNGFEEKSSVIVSDISLQVTEELIRDFFGIVGNITNFKLQFDRSSGAQVCYIQFKSEGEVQTAIDLSGTTLLDKKISVKGMNGQTSENSATVSVGSPLSGLGNPLGIITPQLQYYQQQYGTGQASVLPPLPSALDKAEEIARTVYIGNLDGRISEKDIIDFFAPTCGPIEFVKMAGEVTQPTRYAFVSFIEKDGAISAMSMGQQSLKGRPVKVNSSKNPIVKPQIKKDRNLQRKLDFVLSALDNKARGVDGRKQSRKRSRSPSPMEPSRKRQSLPRNEERRKSSRASPPRRHHSKHRHDRHKHKSKNK